ncbi:polyprenyl synthetase family protein [Patescibacteria group bacterium]|nr:polyprenyl synthetase family protein [Patescibacteria group bacterium]
MEINFIKELEKLKKPVWKEIQKYLPNKEPCGHYKMIKDYPTRQGKYFRPGLVLLSTQMFGGKIKDAILTATAMQMSEDWLLIHDDIEDHSEERRHKPTLNILHGDELAINTGDALHILMWKVIGNNTQKMNSEKAWEVFNKLNEILLIATEGQYLELKWIRDNKITVTEKEYLNMVKRKTAYYTVIGPLQLGAIIAGADDKELKKIEEWGIPFGYAFQIWDDYMNLITSRERQGKENAGDILEGKRTLILSHLIKNCSIKEKEKVSKIYFKKRIEKTESDKTYILKLMHKYKSMDYAREQAKRFSQKALNIFEKNTSHLKDTKAKKIIKEGINFVSNREK